MISDCTCPFRVGDLVYWRHNAGKKVESIWKGPVITVKAKSDTLFIVNSRREVRTMLCNYRKQVIDEESSINPRVPVPKSVKPFKIILKKTEHTYYSPADYLQPICWRMALFED